MSESSYKVYVSEEYVDQRVPPSPDGIHKMLVTGADGSTKWEDRTHWTERHIGLVVDNVTLETSGGEPVTNPFALEEIVEGQTYIVTWNGTAYECIAYIAVGPNAPAIGNGELADIAGGNGEPFFFVYFSGAMLAFAEEGTHTVSIVTGKAVFHTIDPNYLPEGCPYEKTVQKVLYDGKPSYKGNGSYGTKVYVLRKGVPLTVISGAKYEITIDGVTYETVAYPETGEIMATIEEEMFAVFNDISGKVLLQTTLTGFSHVTITETITTIHPLDPKYLPEDHINTLIDTKLEAAHPTELITIPASAWTGTEAPYFAMNQACSIATMTNKLSVSLSPTLTNPDDGMAEILSASTYNAIAEARIMAVIQADGAISFAAYGKKPEIDIPVIVTEVG